MHPKRCSAHNAYLLLKYYVSDTSKGLKRVHETYDKYLINFVETDQLENINNLIPGHNDEKYFCELA